MYLAATDAPKTILGDPLVPRKQNSNKHDERATAKQHKK